MRSAANVNSRQNGRRSKCACDGSGVQDATLATNVDEESSYGRTAERRQSGPSHTGNGTCMYIGGST